MHLWYSELMKHQTHDGGDLKEIIKATGFKVTPGRLAILSIFSDDCGALCAEDIHTKIGKKSLDYVTVYRTLESFEQAGILKKVFLRKQAAYYERAGHHHHHIVCTGCGTVEQFDSCGVESVAKNVLSASKQFKAIKDHSLEFFGVCKRCVTV